MESMDSDIYFDHRRNIHPSHHCMATKTIGVIKAEKNFSPNKASEMTAINNRPNIADMASTSSSSTSSSSSVDEILEKLVEHYSQSVHQKVNNDGNEQQQQHHHQYHPPYFDPLLGNNNLKVPSIIQYFLESLMEEEEVEEGPMLHQPKNIFDGINGYVKYIRPTIVPTSNNSKSSTYRCCCVPVLEHYEILISQWMKRILQQQQQPPPPNSTSSSASTRTTLVHTTPKMIDDDLQNRQQQQQLQNIFYTIEVISSDITILSSSSVIKKDSLSSNSRCNIVIPCLLRILSHTFNLMNYFDIRLFDNNNNNNKNNRSLDDDDNEDDEEERNMQQRTTKSIISCIVSLLAFDTPTILDPRNVAKSSLLNFHIGYMDRFCACPPPLVVLMNSTKTRDAGDEDEGSHSIVDNFFVVEQSKYIDWKSVCIADTTWMDNVSGVTSRAAYGVWIALRSLLVVVVVVDQNNDEYHDDDDARTEKGQIPYFQHTIKDKEITIRSILKLFDTKQLAKAVREHFFGLDLKLWEKETRVSERVIMGRRVTRTELVIKDKPFQVIPSRVNVAMNFLRRLGRCNQEEEEQQQQVDDDDLSWPSSRKRDLLIELMPIIFELLDAANAAHIALGVSSLIRLLDVIQPTKESIEGFAEPVMSALDLDFTSRREEAILFLIGQAQIRLVPHLDDPNKRRRKLTKRWLSLLSQSAGRLNTINLCFVVLIGGVIPLLYQHTQQPNADAMELSRLGLSAILPLLDNEFYHDDTNIHSAALLALLNLMIGGYPAMPDHGGKIICSILALALSSQESSSSDNDNDKKYSPKTIRELCIHTGAVALNLCGDKYAGKLLDELETKHDTYQRELFTVIADVKNNAKTLSDE